MLQWVLAAPGPSAPPASSRGFTSFDVTRALQDGASRGNADGRAIQLRPPARHTSTRRRATRSALPRSLPLVHPRRVARPQASRRLTPVLAHHDRLGVGDVAPRAVTDGKAD